MRLKTKMTVSAVLLVISAVAACCALILRFTWEMALSGAATTALSDMEQFCNSFLEAYDNPDFAEEETVVRSYALYRFRTAPGSNEFTLSANGEYLSNNVGFAPEPLLTNKSSALLDGMVQYRHVRISGTSYLLLGKVLELGAREYSICLVRDVSELTASVASLAVKCMITSMAIIMIAALLMWFIVLKSLKPVEKLKAGASQLAHGNYENRIQLAGKDELAKLASDFNAMAEAIETNMLALHDKTEQLSEKTERQPAFINDLSHEMKTPVTSILLNAEMLLSRKVTEEVLEKSLEHIYSQAKWLERLSQKLMTLILLQRGIQLDEESVEALL